MSQEPISANVDSQEIPQEPISANVVAFPTDSKVREQEARRAAKEAGQEIVVVKRKKFVQNHTDDCGEDMSSIGASEILFIYASVQCTEVEFNRSVSILVVFVQIRCPAKCF